MISCYLCGTQHGLHSIAIHMKQCRIKLAAQPPERLHPQIQRGTMLPLNILLPAPNASTRQVEEYNAEAQSVYTKSLPSCIKCGRSFATTDKAVTHASSCKAQAQPRRPNTNQSPSKVLKLPNVANCNNNSQVPPPLYDLM